MANGTDAVSYERLETCLIERYPKANVYKLLKTFDELVLNRLYLGGTISIEVSDIPRYCPSFRYGLR